MKLSTLTLAALGLIALSTGAHAQTLFGTFGFNYTGNATFVGSDSNDVSTATSITIPTGEKVNTVPPTYFVNGTTYTNGFTTAPYLLVNGTPVNLTSQTFANGGSVGISFAAGGYNFVFTPSTPILIGGTSNAFGNFAAFSEGGVLSGDNGFVSQLAQLAGNFNQTSAGGAVNGSFTFSTPPPSTVPEPGAIAMLAGVGVTGVGFLARRRK